MRNRLQRQKDVFIINLPHFQGSGDFGSSSLAAPRLEIYFPRYHHGYFISKSMQITNEGVALLKVARNNYKAVINKLNPKSFRIGGFKDEK